MFIIRRPRAAFDVDDTLIDSRPIVNAFFAYLLKQGIKHDLNLFRETHCIHTALLGADSNQHFERFYAAGKAPPPAYMPGAQWALELIHQRYDTPFVTSRSGITIQAIMPHLKRHVFPGRHRPHITTCRGLPKRDALAELKPAFFVENSAAEITHLLDVPGLIIIQYPWLLGGPIRRVHHPNVVQLQASILADQGAPEDVIFQSAWQETQHIILA